MSGPLHIRDARPSDEPELRRLAEAEMLGTIRMAFAQSPDFFAAERIRGETRLGILTDDGSAVLGCGARVVRRAWFDGAWRRTGYYCTLRATSSGRNARALAKAYEWAREIERADPLPVITSTIMAGNLRARRLLTSRRFGLPAYLDAGAIVTYTATGEALSRFGEASGGCGVVTGEDVGETALREYYSSDAGRQPLFPELPHPLPPGLRLGDFLVVVRRGRIAAAAALWDQSALRQVRITGYDPWLGAVRPLANVALRAFGMPVLPRPGSDLRFRYLAFRRMSGDDEAVRALFSGVGSAAGRRGLVSFSVHELDPLSGQLSRLRAVRVTSRLYTLSYDDDPQPVDFGGAPYVEAAML